MVCLPGLQEFQTFIRAISKAISSIIVLGRSQPEAHLSCVFGLVIFLHFSGLRLGQLSHDIQMQKWSISRESSQLITVELSVGAEKQAVSQ